MTDELTRRDFVKLGIAGAAGLAAVPAIAGATGPAGVPPLALPTRPLGRTGHHPFIFSLGGQASLEQAD